jgi:hypothetical protein
MRLNEKTGFNKISVKSILNCPSRVLSLLLIENVSDIKRTKNGGGRERERERDGKGERGRVKGDRKMVRERWKEKE